LYEPKQKGIKNKNEDSHDATSLPDFLDASQLLRKISGSYNNY